MSLLVPAYPGCPGSKAVKRSLLLLLLLNQYELSFHLTLCVLYIVVCVRVRVRVCVVAVTNGLSDAVSCSSPVTPVVDSLTESTNASSGAVGSHRPPARLVAATFCLHLNLLIFLLPQHLLQTVSSQLPVLSVSGTSLITLFSHK